MVERRHFLGQPQRMAQRQHLDTNADLYAKRARGYGAGENERRRGDRPLRREVQFGEPDRVEAPAFSGVGLGKGLSECLGVGPSRVARKLQKNAEFECHADARPPVRAFNMASAGCPPRWPVLEMSARCSKLRARPVAAGEDQWTAKPDRTKPATASSAC